MMLLYISVLILVAGAWGVHQAQTTTPAPLPDAVRIAKMEHAMGQLTRQVMLQQLYVEEQTRSTGDSGIKQLRLRTDGLKTYDTATFTGRSTAAMHDHSNLVRTPGLGEMIAVLNGVEFRTRHNDYKVKMPAQNKTYNQLEDIPFPPVPLSVLQQPNVNRQSAEMREYFKAWQDGNTTHRDYRPYFKPVLCYLEGAWTLDENIEEPFASDRHSLDASSWFDLQEKIRYTSMTGDRINSQNFAYLPTTIYNIEDGIPSFAQWNYRIACHPLKAEVSLSQFIPLDDLGHRMAWNKDFDQYLITRMPRFMVDDKGGQNHFYLLGLLDHWMSEIPGKDNYGAHMVDDAFGATKVQIRNNTPLNVAYYHRRFKTSQTDAMGDKVGRRGYADRNLYVAENTQPRIAPTKMTYCQGRGQHRTCKDYVKRLSYAIPLEVIFLTPLNTWNPFDIEYYGSYKNPGADAVQKDGRNGRTNAALAYNGTHSKAYYFTPVSFFSGDEVGQDSADTTRKATGVLDRHGNLHLMKSSGIRTLLPNIPGVGVVRTRYPIMPAYVEGSAIWKELEALRDVVMDMEANVKFIRKPPVGLNISASTDNQD